MVYNDCIELILISDLHIDVTPLDLTKFKTLDNVHKYLVIAGDVYTGTNKPIPKIIHLINLLSFYFKKIIFCLGNHDYYGYEIDEVDSIVYSELDKYKNDKLIYLDGHATYTIPDTKIIICGGILWSYMKEDNNESNIEDYAKILHNNKPLTFNKTNELNAIYVNNILNIVKDNSDKTIIIVSHFPPLYRPSRFAFTWLSFYFFNKLIEDNISLLSKKDIIWLYGHLHETDSYKSHGIYFYNNARGYSNKCYEGLSILVDK